MRRHLRYLGVWVVLSLVIARVWVSPAQDQNCVPAPIQMRGWWTGNGDANDLVGGNNGTMDNTITFAPGRVGQGFNFTGAHNGVKIAASPQVHIGAGTGMTIEAWIN